jgi:hypothetical protein
MAKSEFNLFIRQLSELIIPLNHIIYEIVILILIFIFFKNTNFITQVKQKFIYLFIIFVLIIDWYIWKDFKKTLLFAVILFVYCNYFFQNQKTIATFLNYVDITKDETNIINKENAAYKYNIMVESDKKNMIENEITKLTYYPPDMDPNYINKLQYINTDKYKINEIDGYFETNLQSKLEPDEFTKASLVELYESPQYKNIINSDIDKYLDDNIHNVTNVNNVTNKKNSKEKEFENIALFRNPKKVFLDSNWYNNQQQYYNDHCYSSGETDEFVKFGYKLEKCTNEQSKLLDHTLTLINNNNVSPIYKDFTPEYK